MGAARGREAAGGPAPGSAQLRSPRGHRDPDGRPDARRPAARPAIDAYPSAVGRLGRPEEVAAAIAFLLSGRHPASSAPCSSSTAAPTRCCTRSPPRLEVGPIEALTGRRVAGARGRAPCTRSSCRPAKNPIRDEAVVPPRYVVHPSTPSRRTSANNGALAAPPDARSPRDRRHRWLTHAGLGGVVNAPLGWSARSGSRNRPSSAKKPASTSASGQVVDDVRRHSTACRFRAPVSESAGSAVARRSTSLPPTAASPRDRPPARRCGRRGRPEDRLSAHPTTGDRAARPRRPQTPRPASGAGQARAAVRGRQVVPQRRADGARHGRFAIAVRSTG